jgi:NAD+ kinase
LNEALFCHSSPAATSRYILSIKSAGGTVDEEEQKSSGMWIGPAAGSTAAQRSAGGRVLPLSSTKLQYVVREPYAPFADRGGGPMRLTLGLIDPEGTLTLRSKMRTAKIFADGGLTVFDVDLGDVVVMRRSDEPLTVLGLTRNGEKRAKEK